MVLSTVLRVVSAALLIGLLFPRDAFAYLDPGSGSLMFQTIVATLAAVAYGVRLYWSRITSWFRREAPSNSAPLEASLEPPNEPKG